MFNSLRNLLRNDEGATLVEYSLVVALIAGVAITVITTLGGNITALFTSVGNAVSGANKSIT